MNVRESAIYDKDSEDDETFQPPALSSYAVSLLNEINSKNSLIQTRTDNQEGIGTKLYNFQPRLSSINNSLSADKRYSITHEKTGTTMESKRTSIGYNSTTPYTEFLHDEKERDSMEVPLVKNSKPEVPFDMGKNEEHRRDSSTPMVSQTFTKMPVFGSRKSLLEPTRGNKPLRRFARANLGAPKRISQRDTDGINHLDLGSACEIKDANNFHSLGWIEEEKEKIRAKNRETLLRLSEYEKKELTNNNNTSNLNEISQLERRLSDIKTLQNNRFQMNKVILPGENNYHQNPRIPNHHLEKENIRQNLPSDKSQVSANRRRVLSEISPNIDNPRRNSMLKRTSMHETKTVDQMPAQNSYDIAGRPSISVNDRSYEKLELIGKGGTSKVYKLRSKTNGKVYAIKRVTFDEFDASAIKGFKGEIDLLKKLSSEQRVVKLYDFSMNEGSLMLVMECGDIDLAHVLTSRMNMPLDIGFVRYHMVEMLKCVSAVHQAGIIHSDLKPANFLFVKGILKIIDFGIANALSDHTVNIYRESQIGTPNYMSPESLLEVNSGINVENNRNGESSTWRVGRLSDVWSCGCIIYQMIYGRPPYASYTGNQRLLAIMNPQVKISYPETGLGGVKVPRSILEVIQNCLQRDPNKRWTIEQVLNGSFCRPKNVSKEFIEDLVKNAINFGATNGEISKESLDVLTCEVWSKIEELNI